MSKKFMKPAAMAMVLGLAVTWPTVAQVLGQEATSLKVCATVPELGSLVKEIGGNQPGGGQRAAGKL